MLKPIFGMALLGLGLAASMALPGSGLAASTEVPAPPWPDDPASRLAALALIETLAADLLSHDSATLTLDRWCATHRLAELATVVAERQRGVDKPPSEAQRRLLGVGDAEPIGYRRVRLSCGQHVLSEADNWYVPARLMPEMNRALDTSDIAFGRAVQALGFSRRTLSSELLWHPLPDGWETGAALPAPQDAALPIPHDLLRNSAVLTLPDGTPFSTVVETYTREVLAFPRPAGF